MQSMNISLPDPLKQFVDGQIAQGPVQQRERIRARADPRRRFSLPKVVWIPQTNATSIVDGF